MHRPSLPPVNIDGTHFYWRLSQPQCHNDARRIMSMKNSIQTIMNRTRELHAVSAVPQPPAPTNLKTLFLLLYSIKYIINSCKKGINYHKHYSHHELHISFTPPVITTPICTCSLDRLSVCIINLQAPSILYVGQAIRYSPENAFYISNQQIYFII